MVTPNSWLSHIAIYNQTARLVPVVTTTQNGYAMKGKCMSLLTSIPSRAASALTGRTGPDGPHGSESNAPRVSSGRGLTCYEAERSDGEAARALARAVYTSRHSATIESASALVASE
jgi:hypothetical protein